MPYSWWMFATYILAYILSINCVSAYLFWLDWRYSKRRLGVGQIPEGTFLVLSFAGGALGVLIAQRLLLHRLYRKKFGIRVRLYLLMHFAVFLIYNPDVIARSIN